MRRSFKRHYRLVDPEEYELVNQIDVSSSPVSKLRHEDKVCIEEYSPLKSTPQDELVALIDVGTPIKPTLSRYDNHPEIEILSPLKTDTTGAEVIESNDSRHFQSKRERIGRTHRKSLFPESKAPSDRMLSSLYKYLSKSEADRSCLFRDVDDKTEADAESRKHLDIEIAKTSFDVFGKCVIDGQVTAARHFSEEETFEMEDQRIRLIVDQKLGVSFAGRLDSGRSIRLYYPFTLIKDQHSDFIVQDFFFVKSLVTETRRQLKPKIIFQWDCPCRPTDQRVVPAVQPEECFPVQKSLPPHA